MKNFLYTISLLTIVWGCNPVSSKKAVVPEDSLQYYPPTPGQLTKEEFRRYYRILSNYFDSTLPDRNFNGGILIAKNGAIIYERYTGKIDLRKDGAITDSTSFHIASTSKTFTAIAILRMVQENKLSLEDSLTRFFPGFPYPGITVKMLLNHRSGLPNYVYFIPNSKTWDQKRSPTNEDVLNVLYTEKPTRSFPPDKRFSYSNTNFVLLALIIEKLSGIPFPGYMKTRLFQPLRMDHTYIFTPADSARSIPSFNYDGSLYANDNLEHTYGDKNVYSTPRDLLKWDQALYTEQLLRKSLLDSAFAPYSLERPSIHNYGLGFRMLMMPNGKKVIYHFGRWHGFNAAFARLRDEKATIIILGNKFTWKIYNAAMKAYDIFGDYRQSPHQDEEETEGFADEKEKKIRPVKTKSKKVFSKKKTARK